MTDAFARHHRMTRSGGFTLIEMMVVIVLIGLAVTFGVIRFQAYLPRARLEGAARQVGGFLTRLRGMAVFAGRTHYLEYDLDGEAFRISRPATIAEREDGSEEYVETDWFEMPEGVTLERVQFSRQDEETRGIASIEFTPEGEVTGHLVQFLSNRILGEDRSRFTVELNGVTGLVTYTPGVREMRRSATNQTSDRERAGRVPPPAHPAGGFTLLELVAAITLFALIIVYVLADREDSLRMSADAKIIQTVQYLASEKIDEIRHDPDAYGESEGGDFEDLENDWQKFTDYSWELQVERVVVVGKSDDRDATYLFPDDEDEVAPDAAEGKKLATRFLRRLTLTVRYEAGGEDRTDLDVIIKTFLPPSADDEPKPEAGP